MMEKEIGLTHEKEKDEEKEENEEAENETNGISVLDNFKKRFRGVAEQVSSVNFPFTAFSSTRTACSVCGQNVSGKHFVNRLFSDSNNQAAAALCEEHIDQDNPSHLNLGQDIMKRMQFYADAMMEKARSYIKSREYTLPSFGVTKVKVTVQAVDSTQDENGFTEYHEKLQVEMESINHKELRVELPDHLEKSFESSADFSEKILLDNKEHFSECNHIEYADEFYEASNHEDEDLSPHSAAGQALIGLQYNHDRNLFEVMIHNVSLSANIHTGAGSVDCYVKVYLISSTDKHQKRKTKVVKNSLSPEFDEVLCFEIEHEELVTSLCRLSVWKYEFSNNNMPLAEVDIHIEEFLGSGFSLKHWSPHWYTLYAVNRTFRQLDFCGEIALSLCYEPPNPVIANTKREQLKLPNPVKGQLHLVIKEVKLSNGSLGELYCKLSLVLADTKSKTLKTRRARATSGACWNQNFLIENISWLELRNSYLQLKVKADNDVVLGGVRLGLGDQEDVYHDSFGEEVKSWLGMLDHPNQVQQLRVPLRNSLDSIKQYCMSVPNAKVEEALCSKWLQPRQKLLDEETESDIESSGSVYSGAGERNLEVSITGELLISVKYDLNNEDFTVFVEKAKNLSGGESVDVGSLPYCRILLLPDETMSSKRKTKHCRKTTTNPTWNEAITYSINRVDLLEKILQVAVWNHDKLGRNDFLGEVQLSLHHYSLANNLNTLIPVWYNLQEIHTKDAPVRDNETSGELNIGIKFDHGSLHVDVIQGKNLSGEDGDEEPNPFVRCFLLPDTSKESERKTRTQKKTTYPLWKEVFRYDGVSIEDLYWRVLEVTVWDAGEFSHHFIGGVRLGLPQGGEEEWNDSYEAEVQIWELMMKNLGISTEYSMPLRRTMVSRKGDYEDITAADSIDDVTGEIPPMIHFSLQYSHSGEDDLDSGSTGTLIVHVEGARFLPVDDNGNPPSSTFCRLVLYHEHFRNYTETAKTLDDTAHPDWQEKVQFDGLAIEDFELATLEIQVWSYSTEHGEDRIGCVRLHQEEENDITIEEGNVWRRMLSDRSKPVPVILPLVKEDCIDNQSDLQSFDPGLDVEGDENQVVPERDSPETVALRAMGIKPPSPTPTSSRGISSSSHMRPENSQPDESLHRYAYNEDINTEDSNTSQHNVKKKYLKHYVSSKETDDSLLPLHQDNKRSLLPIHGEIQFATKYDFARNAFEVHVYQAKDVSAADTINETSHPYCKAYLLPDVNKSAKRKTTVRRDTFCPEWEEILEFKVPWRDLRTRTLWLSLYHFERFGRNVFLGEVLLNLNAVADGFGSVGDARPRWYPLCERTIEAPTKLFKGHVKLKIMFQQDSLSSQGMPGKSSGSSRKRRGKTKATGKVNVHIIEAIDLPACDMDGYSDPFCKCALLPMKSANAKKTSPIIKHTLNPVWDYKFDYSLDYEDIALHGIEITVWDWDLASSNDFLGACHLNLGALESGWDDGIGIEVECWQHLIDTPNVWKEFVVPLRSKVSNMK